MKKTIINYAIAVILTAMSVGEIQAQPRIHYGRNNSYMYWPMPCEGTIVLGQGIQPSEDPLFAQVFQYNHEETDSPCTIYGVASSIVPFHSSSSTYTFSGSIWPIGGLINIYLFEANVGDSVVNLVKTSVHTVHVGKEPDRVLIITDSISERQPMREQYLHEFYFDEPITVSGPFLIGIMGSGFDLNRGEFDLIECHSYYPMVQVDTKSQKLLKSNGQTDILHDIDSLPYLSRDGQSFYPILVPEGSFIGVEQPQDAASVRLTPNPARTEVTVEAGCAVRSMEVVDIMGCTVIRKDNPGGAQRAALDVSRLPQGCYAVRLNTAHGILTEKLVVK